VHVARAADVHEQIVGVPGHRADLDRHDAEQRTGSGAVDPGGQGVHQLRLGRRPALTRTAAVGSLLALRHRRQTLLRPSDAIGSAGTNAARPAVDERFP
jgi:hypothetical protein